MQTKTKLFSSITFLLLVGFQLLGLQSFAFYSTSSIDTDQVSNAPDLAIEHYIKSSSLLDDLHLFAELMEEIIEEDLEEENDSKESISKFLDVNLHSRIVVALQAIQADLRFSYCDLQPKKYLPLYLKFLVFRL